MGSEYIIIDRLYGESLASRWLSLSTAEVKEVMTQLVAVERKIFAYRCPAYGSLYYRDEISEKFNDHSLGLFGVGPISKRQFWFGEREKMQIDRGPFQFYCPGGPALCWLIELLISFVGTKPEDYLAAPALRESTWISKYGKSQPRRTFLLQTDHDIDPSEHTLLLSKYLLAAPSLVPDSKEMSTPTLRHPDLSLANNLLEPNSTKIQGLIDWQDAAILPFFMQVGYPAFCENDMSRAQAMTRPKSTNNFDERDGSDKEKVMIKFRLEEGNLYYTAATGIDNSPHVEALRIRGLGLKQYLISQAGCPWDTDLANLRSTLVNISQNWKNISSASCPIFFSVEEQEKARSDASEWNESADILSTFRGSIGIDPEGGTEPARFEYARFMNEK